MKLIEEIAKHYVRRVENIKIKIDELAKNPKRHYDYITKNLIKPLAEIVGIAKVCQRAPENWDTLKRNYLGSLGELRTSLRLLETHPDLKKYKPKTREPKSKSRFQKKFSTYMRNTPKLTP